MANYILYHPNNYENTKQVTMMHEHMYCTEIMALSICQALREEGHTAEMQYINTTQSETGRHTISFEIPELELDVDLVPSSLWFLIGNVDTGKFVMVDLQDSPGPTYRMYGHKNLVFSLLGQFSMERYRRESNGNLDLTKIRPFVYCAYYPLHVREMREEIQEIRRSTEKLDDRVFFYGNNRDTYVHSDDNGERQKIREVISVLADKYPDESCVGSWEDKLPADDFFRKAATHTISLGLPGHQWCSREHELWTLGLPVMLYEHTHKMAIDLIPNYHYVAVAAGPRLSIGMAKDPELAADQIIQAHREWIKPERRWMLDAIAKHGQERMDKYASPEVLGKNILHLLELGHW